MARIGETDEDWQGLELIIGVLRDKELFFGLSEPQLESVAGAAELRMFKAGDWIFREGTPGDAVCVVESGEVDIYKEREQGRKVPLATMKPGAVFGEMALVHVEPRSASAIASRDATLVVLDFGRLSELFDRDRDLLALLALNIARVLAKRLRKISDEYSVLYLSDRCVSRPAQG